MRPDNLGLALSGGGYAELTSQTRLSLSPGFSISMLVERSSESGEGLLLWLGSFDQFLKGHYLSIALKESDRGKLAVADWKFGEDRSRIKLLTGRAAASPLYISLRVSGRRVHFTVDSLTESKPLKGSTMPAAPLYLGGVPDLKITGGRHQSNFQGCIHSIKLDNDSLSFADDFNLFNVENDQSCRIEKFPPRIPPTTTTRTTPTTTTTVRPSMPVRMKCQDDQKLILNGQGYFELKSKVVTSKANSQVEIEIGFSTFSTDGILLQKRSKLTNDSITIELVDGKIKFQMFYGVYREGLEIISEDKYNDGEDHLIQVKKLENGRGSLQVDKADSKEASAALGRRLDVLDTSRAAAYIGGIPGDSRRISGCVSHLGFWNRPEGANPYGSARLVQLGWIIGYGGSSCAAQCSAEYKTNSRTTESNFFDFLG